MFRPNLLSLVVAVAVCPPVIQAQTERDLDSHEHGAASINVVIDGKTVFVEFESPWNNLVGFEHSPSTDDQRQAVADAMQILETPANLFVFNDNAGCQVSSTEVESTLETNAEHDEHEHGHDDHKDEHAGHDDHADHGEDTHSEVVAMYSFDCAKPEKIESVAVKLFDFYSGFESIGYQAAGPSGQTGAALSASDSTLDLSDVR